MRNRSLRLLLSGAADGLANRLDTEIEHALPNLGRRTGRGGGNFAGRRRRDRRGGAGYRFGMIDCRGRRSCRGGGGGPRGGFPIVFCVYPPGPWPPFPPPWLPFLGGSGVL